jgi:Ni/Co efflux regulator RcnB
MNTSRIAMSAVLATAALAIAQPTAAKPHDGHGPPGLAKKPYGLPPGQAKKLWRQGERLPRNYYVETRYVVVPQRYSLPIPPPGYRWVGVNGDAYLVQTQTGMIADLVRDLLR